MQEEIDDFTPKRLKEDDRYLIYPNGAVRRKDKASFLQWEITDTGYARVGIDGKKMYVHRLVASNFLDNSDDLPEVNHKDENKLNNHFSNLEWCTREYNNAYGTGPQRRSNSCRNWPWRTKDPRPIVQCDIDNNFMTEYPFPAEAARQVGCTAASLVRAANHLAKKEPHNCSCGYLWYWKKDYDALGQAFQP